ncbi:MAG: hypothetical protein VX023_04420 [Candidatus Thermoplasmatota archaeon]|nr:hypothetical protein [Candidatus Thermoplasmatota archaeon]
MLGDSLPLFFPVLLFMLCLWLVADRVDRYFTRFSPMVQNRLSSTYRIVPILMLAWLVISRARSFINRDVEHVEVANRLQGSEFATSDFILLVTGDGVGELALLFLLIFSQWTVNLPSMSHAPHELRKAVQAKVMLYVSACALLTFWIFFPESNYYSPDTLPAKPTMSANGDYSAAMVVLVTLMIAFSGELFAITSLQHHGEHFSLLKKRALLKTYVVAGTVLFGLFQGENLAIDFVTNKHNNIIIATLLFLSQSLVLAFVCIPGTYSDSLLKVGQARTKSFALMSLFVILILLIITSVVLQNTDEYATGNRYLHESLWLTASFLIILSALQVLPRYGFDSAARPEFWWLRLAIVFAPALIYWFNPLALFLLPALWLIGAASIVLPNLVELDATTPPKQGISALVVISITLIVFTASTTNMLANFILFGAILLVTSNIVSNSIKH